MTTFTAHSEPEESQDSAPREMEHQRPAPAPTPPNTTNGYVFRPEVPHYKKDGLWGYTQHDGKFWYFMDQAGYIAARRAQGLAV